MANDGKTESGWVRVMCDHFAEGIWDAEGCPMSPEDLPVPPDLHVRLRAWQDVFERFIDRMPVEELESFGAEGLEIARAIKAHLPGWTVIYHDERRYPSDDADIAEIEAQRSHFEYEVSP